MVMNLNIRKRKHRLPGEAYKGICVVSFTLCIKNRKEFFITEDIFRYNENLLLTEMRKFLVEAEVYLFMPDHAHFLLRGILESSNVLSAVKAYKQQSGFWLRHHYPAVHWQKDFYDRIERSDEDVNKRIRYILNNPDRKGLVDDWLTYPFKGSTIHSFKEWN